MSSINALNELRPVLSIVSASANPAASKIVAIRRAFGFLPEAELHRLMPAVGVRSFRRKQSVFRCGDPAVSLNVVMEGFVKLSTMHCDGREIVLDIVGPDVCIGELTVLHHWTHSTDATALSQCRVLSIDVRKFRQLLERNPACLLEVMRIVGERLQKRTEQLIDALTLPAPAHLAKAILSLVQNAHGAVGPRLRQNELATMTGLSRESVNKYLRAWSEAGWIRMVNGSVGLVNVAALGQLTGEERRPSGRIESERRAVSHYEA